jgi:methyl-accepting chemotaxis protein
MNTVSRMLLDLSVRKKLLGSFGLILIITLVTAWIGNASLDSTLHRIDNLLGVSEIDANLMRARQQEEELPAARRRSSHAASPDYFAADPGAGRREGS